MTNFTLFLIFFGICFISALLAAIFGLRPMRALARRGRRIDSSTAATPAPASLALIVYAKNADDHIADFIRTIFRQNHPDFEVVIVNDASIDNTREIVETLMEEYPRLRMTFVPESARNVSRRKTAFTLGIKATEADVVLLTSSNCKIPSDSWLSEMSAPFANPEKEMVIGLTRIPPETNTAKGRRYRAFDSLSILAQWAGSALLGSPYRGDSMNLAFRRSTFFANKGFASSTPFKAGEDDIFVNNIANKTNSAIVISPDATPAVIWEASEYPRLWLGHKESHIFTSRYLHTAALRRQGFHSLMLWLSLATGAAAVYTAWPDPLLMCAPVVVTVLLWCYQICLYRRTARFMRDSLLRLTVPLYWLMRPLVNAVYRSRFSADKSKNYTWERSK